MNCWLNFDCTEEQATARGQAQATALKLIPCNGKWQDTLYRIDGEVKTPAGLYRHLLRIAQETKDNGNDTRDILEADTDAGT